MPTFDFRNCYHGRTVLVTGHTGFKGSWLSVWLEWLGARVIGYSLQPLTDPNHFQACDVRGLLARHIHGDVRDVPALTAVLREMRPDLILHLAAQSVVREGYRSPLDTFDVNVMGTAGVLEAVRRAGHPAAVVCVTTDKVYENLEQPWGYREDDRLGGFDPYSASKGAAEIVIASYRRSYFCPDHVAEHGARIASARAGNVIGGGDFKRDALVVDVVKSLAAGAPVEVRNPRAVRPWQHVLECLSGYLTLGARLLSSDEPIWQSSYNFGPLPGGDLPVAELVERFLAVWGEGSWVDASDPNAPHEATLLRLAIDKALWRLEWAPVWTIEDALTATAAWYRRYYDLSEAAKPQSDRSADLLELTRAQISAYEDDAWGQVVKAPALSPSAAPPASTESSEHSARSA
jgi:CDP-glucose 4,6-dehydratase